jgi:hypothetical protein
LKQQLKIFISIDLDADFAFSGNGYSISDGLIQLVNNPADVSAFGYDNNITSMSTIDNAIDLMKLGGYRCYNTFSFSIVDGGLLDAMFDAQVTFKNKVVEVYVNLFDGTTSNVVSVYKGVIKDFSQSSGEISLQCTDISELKEGSLDKTTIGYFNNTMRFVSATTLSKHIFNINPNTGDDLTLSLEDGDIRSVSYIAQEIPSTTIRLVRIPFSNSSYVVTNANAIEICDRFGNGTGDIYRCSPWDAVAGLWLIDFDDNIKKPETFTEGGGSTTANTLVTYVRLIKIAVSLDLSNRFLNSWDSKAFEMSLPAFSKLSSSLASRASYSIINEDGIGDAFIRPNSVDVYSVGQAGAVTNFSVTASGETEIPKDDFKYDYEISRLQTPSGTEVATVTFTGLATSSPSIPPLHFFKIMLRITDADFLEAIQSGDIMYCAMGLEAFNEASNKTIMNSLAGVNDGNSATSAILNFYTASNQINPFYDKLVSFKFIKDINPTIPTNNIGQLPFNIIEKDRSFYGSDISLISQYSIIGQMQEENNSELVVPQAYNTPKDLMDVEVIGLATSNKSGSVNPQSNKVYFQAVGAIRKKHDYKTTPLFGEGENYTNDPDPASDAFAYPTLAGKVARYLLNTQGGYVNSEYVDSLAYTRADFTGIHFQDDGTTPFKEALDGILNCSNFLLTGTNDGKRKLIDLYKLASNDTTLASDGDLITITDANLIDDSVSRYFTSDDDLINSFDITWDAPYGEADKYFLKAVVDSNYANVTIQTNAHKQPTYQSDLASLIDTMTYSASIYKTVKTLKMSFPHLQTDLYPFTGITTICRQLVEMYGFKRRIYTGTIKLKDVGLINGKIGTPVKLNSAVGTLGQDVYGILQGVTIDLFGNASFEIVTTAKDLEGNSYIMETGSAVDTIQETGSAIDTIEETGS